MAQSEFQSDQLVNEAALAVLRQAARAQGNTLLAAIDQNFQSPLRLFASIPSDAVLNIAAAEVQLADGTGKSVPPNSSTIPTVPASTINFQTGGTTGATFTGLTFPTTTVGQFRRLGLSLLASGQIGAIWSAAAASVGALANPGTVFIPSGIPIGWIDLEATAATAYKTAGSATSIIENAVGGTSRIKVFGSGGGGSGTGNANSFLIELQDRLINSYFNALTANIFEQDGTAKTNTGTSTGSYDIANRVFSLPTIGNTLVSLQQYISTFLANTSDSVQAELEVLWGTTDTAAVYEMSRDGGLNWLTMSMARVGVSPKYRGIGIFPEPVTVSNLIQNDVANADATNPFSATTQQMQSTAFTVNSGTKYRTSVLRFFFNKVGSPLGMIWAQIVKDNGSGSPDLTQVVVETSQVSIAGLAAGNIQVDMPVTQPLPAGNYHIVVKTDLAYKNSFVSTTQEIRWRVDVSSPSYAGAMKYYDGTTWTTIGTTAACFAIRGIPYDLRVRITSANANVTIYGTGVLYEEDTVSLPADTEEHQEFDVNGDSDQTAFPITNFNVNPRTLKVYDVDNNQVYRFPKFAVNGNTVTFATGTFLSPGKVLRVIFEQDPAKAGYNSDKLSAVLATNGLGSTDTNFDFSSAGVGLKLRSPDGTKWHLRVLNDGSVQTIVNGW